MIDRRDCVVTRNRGQFGDSNNLHWIREYTNREESTGEPLQKCEKPNEVNLDAGILDSPS